jgi:hypothetical protein
VKATRSENDSLEEDSYGEWPFQPDSASRHTQVGGFLRATMMFASRSRDLSLKSNCKGCARRPLFSRTSTENAENLALRAGSGSPNETANSSSSSR